eukprot:s1328_g18.t1
MLSRRFVFCQALRASMRRHHTGIGRVCFHCLAWRTCRRRVLTLPQIPGVIFSNSEIPDDKLVGQVRQWASASPVLSQNKAFDLLQVAEVVDGRALPRVLCGILRTRPPDRLARYARNSVVTLCRWYSERPKYEAWRS